MALKEFKTKTDDELKTSLNEMKREQMNLRFQSAQGSLEKPARLRVVRRDIARINTLMSQRRGEKSNA